MKARYFLCWKVIFANVVGENSISLVGRTTPSRGSVSSPSQLSKAKPELQYSQLSDNQILVLLMQVVW
jgi:hypothetical protein